jgi:hypothetical protein
MWDVNASDTDEFSSAKFTDDESRPIREIRNLMWGQKLAGSQARLPMDRSARKVSQMLLRNGTRRALGVRAHEAIPQRRGIAASLLEKRRSISFL